MKTQHERAIVTIVTNDYFHQAMVLWRSIKRFERKSKFIVFVIGYDKADADYQQTDFTVLDAKVLISQEWKQFVFQYDGLQASCALKPLAMLYLLKEYEKVIYLDADMKLFGPLQEGWRLLAESDLSLTPHSYIPIKDDGLDPPRVTIRVSGLFNAGYVGASRGGIPFLEWWWKQTKHNCLIAHARGIFLDQVYLNDAAYMVSRLGIVRDDGYNVACWNLHERALKQTGKEYMVNEKPLTLFHFSSYAESIKTRPPLSGKEIFEELYFKYKKEVQLEKRKVLPKKYPFQHFEDGKEISALERDWMRRGIPELEKVEDPFLVTCRRREEIKIIMKQREEDYRPQLDREVYALPSSQEEGDQAEEASSPRAIVAIVTNDHFYQAMVLWRSIQKFEKESDFFVFVVGYDAADPNYQKAGFTVLDAKALNPKNWDQFVFQYHPLEVCCALKPRALLHLLTRYKKVIYLDTDMRLFAPMKRAWEALQEADLSLTPHSYTPIPAWGVQPSRFFNKMVGIFNGGYVGASRGSIAFLEWWWQQTEYNCLTLVYIGVYLDQIYLNYAVSLVKHLHVMEDPGYNAASWNYHERKLEQVGSEYFVNKKPLICFHFSGWMKNPTFSALKKIGILSAELFVKLYRQHRKLLSAEKKKLSERKYPYAHFQDGEEVDKMWREWARRDIPELKNISNPFLLMREERERIEETMMMRPRDFRPNPGREIVLTPAIPYECLYITTPLELTE